MDQRKTRAIIYAFMAAVFYAINIPISKILLQYVGPTTMAALLYLGAGIGIGALSLLNRKDRKISERLSKKDLPFVIGMIVLDIAAPIFLMLGIGYSSSANASLLGNFEIVATTVIALFIFKEVVSKRLWLAIMIIGSMLVVTDTLIRHHAHEHQHTFTHTHDGTTHTHTVTHSHGHNHYMTDDKHGHRHSDKELESLPGATHV